MNLICPRQGIVVSGEEPFYLIPLNDDIFSFMREQLAHSLTVYF